MYLGDIKDINSYDYPTTITHINKSQRSLLVVGDSYSPRIARPLLKYSYLNDLNFYLFSSGFTSKLSQFLPFLKDETYIYSPLKRLINSKAILSGDIVVISTLEKPSVSSFRKTEFFKLAELASSYDLKVVIVGQVPTFHSYQAYNLSSIQDERLCKSYFFRPLYALSPSCHVDTSRTSELSFIKDSDMFFKQLSSDHPYNIFYFSVFNDLCRQEDSTCTNFRDGYSLYTERGVHLSDFAINLFMPRLQNFLSKL
ncbi:SGNH hydrolase domain-containing protein [bacterium]|nr:SGNH hydrolase domain-containing protein [bacterium]